MHLRLKHFKMSDAFLKKFNFNVISIDNLESVYPLLDSETLVLSGPTYFGEIISNIMLPLRIKDACTENMEALYQISKYNVEHKCGAKCVRYFNGDSGFGTQNALDYFNDKMKYVDVLSFDNDALRDLFMKNSEVARKKKTIIAWLETPLKRHVIHNTGKIEKRFISLGRCLSAFDEIRRNKDKLPITFFPIQYNDINAFKYWLMKYGFSPRKLSYNLTYCTSKLHHTTRGRKLFRKYESAAAFGISHMYDAFLGSEQEFIAHKDHYLSIDGQNYAFCAATPKEIYYPFVNNANKEACYMMYGIIPIISNKTNPYYKKLLDNKMAICISSKQELADLLNMPEETIQKYRDNIYKNIDMFTFDNVGEKLIKLLD